MYHSTGKAKAVKAVSTAARTPTRPSRLGDKNECRYARYAQPFCCAIRQGFFATDAAHIAIGSPNDDFYNFFMGCMVQTQVFKGGKMPADPSTPTPERLNLNSRLRDHRFTALPVKDILRIRMKDLGLKNRDLQLALDYPRPNVIAMMKTGSMSLPPGKAVIAAHLLKVDPVFLLSKVIAENDPTLWEAISAVLSDYLITENEMALINMARQSLDGHDVNLAGSPVFVQAVGHTLKATLERENALTQAALKRADE